jgi:uncharacterized protein YdhG (YjbR/CyaY superfamily)
MSKQNEAPTIDQYISKFSAEVQSILQQIRLIIQEQAPEAKEKISYQMPAFTLDGRILIYFAAFKKHIGIYPPVQGDENLMQALAPYLGEKGNLKFPLNQPMPYPLIKEVVVAKLNQHREMLAAKQRKQP